MCLCRDTVVELAQVSGSLRDRTTRDRQSLLVKSQGRAVRGKGRSTVLRTYDLFGGITMTKSGRVSAGGIACAVSAAALAGEIFFANAGLADNLPASALTANDPGVRAAPAGAGGPVPGLDIQSMEFFQAGPNVFGEIEGVALGLGPRFNLDNCAGCHAQPAAGGTSPSTNPQIAAATANGAQNSIPSFVSLHGPVREARLVSDGQVHGLFVITGRSDAPGCSIAQPDLASELSRSNVTFRIPTPLFGAGLVENTSDQDLDLAFCDIRRASD